MRLVGLDHNFFTKPNLEVFYRVTCFALQHEEGPEGPSSGRKRVFSQAWKVNEPYRTAAGHSGRNLEVVLGFGVRNLPFYAFFFKVIL